KNAMLVADAAQLLQELFGRGHVAAFALDGLDKDRGTLLRRHDGLEYAVFNEAHAFLHVLRLTYAFRPAIQIRIGNVRHARHHGKEAAALLDFGRRERKRAHGAAVERAVKGDDALALSVITRQLHGSLDSFSAGVAVIDAYWAGHRRHLRQPLRER